MTSQEILLSIESARTQEELSCRLEMWTEAVEAGLCDYGEAEADLMQDALLEAVERFPGYIEYETQRKVSKTVH